MKLRIPFLRKRFITGEAVQLKYLGLLIVSMVAPLIFVGSCLYFLIFNIVAEQLGIPEHIAITLFPVIKKINTILLLGFPPLFILILLWGVVLSHRFAGPLARLKDEVEAAAKSTRAGHHLRIRKHDDLRPLVEAINKLIDTASKERKR